MNEMSASAQEVARSAAAAVNSASNVNKETISGTALVESQVKNIGRLASEIDQSVAVINQDNAASLRVAQRLGMTKSHDADLDGQPVIIMAIDRATWRDR